MQIESVYVGEIRIFPGSFAPNGWAFCDGRLLDISMYSQLYAVIGTTYGGDGRTSFKLPDLRGRIPMHFYNIGENMYDNHSLGSNGGNSHIKLTERQLPSHSHKVSTGNISSEISLAPQGANIQANVQDPTNAYPAIVNKSGVKSDTFVSPQTGLPLVDMAIIKAKLDMEMPEITVEPEGQGMEFDILPPYLSLGYIIALEGVFPTQSNMVEEILTGLTVQGFELTPQFRPEINQYSINVLESTDKITIVPTANSNNAIIKINQLKVASNQNYNVNLNSENGKSVTTIEVISRDGVVNVYTIKVYKGIPLLRSLIMQGGVIKPKFLYSLFNYEFYMDPSVNKISVSPIVNISNLQPNDVVAIKIDDLYSIITGQTVTYNLKPNQEKITILLQYKKSKETYELYINRTPLLSSLEVDKGSLIPEFSPDVFEYMMSVDKSVDDIYITPTAVNPKMSTLISSNRENEIITAKNDERVIVKLEHGENIIILTLNDISNPNTLISTNYCIRINKNSYKPKLTDLTVYSATDGKVCPLSPKFDSDELQYTLYFRSPCNISVSALTTIYSDKVMVQGMDSTGNNSIELSNGENIITIDVISDQLDKTTYQIVAYVTQTPLLSNIRLSLGMTQSGPYPALQPQFQPNIYQYNVPISFIKAGNGLYVTPYNVIGTDSIWINGTTVRDGEKRLVALPAFGNTSTVKIEVAQNSFMPKTSYEIALENIQDIPVPQILSNYAINEGSGYIRAYAQTNITPCQVFCIVQAKDIPVPTNNQVKNGLDGNGKVALFASNRGVNKNMNVMISIAKLAVNFDYRICFVACDIYGVNSEVNTVVVTTKE